MKSKLKWNNRALTQQNVPNTVQLKNNIHTFLYKNKLYKNTQAEIAQKLRTS